MKTYKVTYNGNSNRFRNFIKEVNAISERDAVEKVFKEVNDVNYFKQDDGSIKDCDGYEIATAISSTIDHDGGLFIAEEVISL